MNFRELGVEFDEFNSESENVRPAHELINNLVRIGFAKVISDKTTVVEEEQSANNIILRKSNNGTLYLSR